MKLVTADLAKQGKGDINLYYLADFHIGDPHSDYKIIRGLLDAVMADDDAYCILGGDLMDSAIISSVSDTYAATLTPQQELEQCVKLFKPLADAGKILGIVGGNHEARIYKNDGVDLTSLLAIQLQLADKYSDATLALLIRTGKKPKGGALVYTIYCTHGSGGSGRKLGGKINRLIDYATVCENADVYIMAHTHSPILAKLSSLRISTQKGSINAVEKLFVNTASTVTYTGGYGEIAGYTPSSNTYPVIHLSGTKKEATATL